MNGSAIVAGVIGIGMAIVVASIVYQLVTHPISVDLASTLTSGITTETGVLFQK